MKLILSAILLALLAACTTYDKPLVMPEPIRLQDPLPGGAVVYLLTSPYDNGAYGVYSEEKLFARLDAGTYTAIFLNAGEHTLLTKSRGLFSSGNDEAPPLHLNLKDGDRVFFYISGIHDKSLPIIIFSPKGGVAYVTGGQLQTKSGTRSWKPCTELDAQGLMSILKVTLPEQ